MEAPARSGCWESVRATGVASADELDEARSVRPYGSGWPCGVATHVVHVPLSQVEGTLRAA